MRTWFGAFLLSVHRGQALTPTLWPSPAESADLGDPVLLASDSFGFTLVGDAASSKPLQTATARYKDLILSGAAASEAGGLSALSVEVANANVPLDFGVDESYNLTVSSDTASLSAVTVWGAIRGLETFSQLVYAENGQLFAQAASVLDRPRFPHRGLLVDTARLYFTVQDLEKIIDSMSWSKLNVLHWHVTDSQSFPLESERFPLLSEKGAFSESSVYDHNDIKHLVEYAESRAVRIMPEIDTPGHSKSWGLGYPNATVVKSCPGIVKNADDIPLNPIEPFAFELVSGVLDEFLGGDDAPFADSFVHLGGDEVVFKCWSGDNDIKEYMTEHGVTALQLEQEWVGKVQQAGKDLGKRPVNWGDVLIVDGEATSDANLLPETVVMAWRDHSELSIVAKSGYSTILSAGWYIDSSSNKNWRDLYANEPLAPAADWTDPDLSSLVIGGEASKWGCSGVCPFPTTPGKKWEREVWPAAAVVAERLWSPATVNNPDEAAPRLQSHQGRLAQRGINAAPINAEVEEMV